MIVAAEIEKYFNSVFLGGLVKIILKVNRSPGVISGYFCKIESAHRRDFIGGQGKCPNSSTTFPFKIVPVATRAKKFSKIETQS